MNKKNIKIIILFFMLIFSSSLMAMEYTSKPLQQLKFIVNDYFSFYFINEMYHNYKKVKEDAITPGFDLKLWAMGNFVFESSLKYLHIIDNKFNNIENRLRGSVTIQYRICGFQFGLRNRLEYRIRDSGNMLRYRPRLKIKTPWKWTALNFSPYLSDELFIIKDGFKSQEIEIGLSFHAGNWGFVLGNIFVIKNPAEYTEDILIIETKYKINL